MKTIFHISKLPRKFRGGIITLGVFDGVHKGHQALFDKIVKRGKRLNAPALVYTFNPHPVHLLAPTINLPLINTLPQRLALLSKQGIDLTFVAPFTKRFSQMSAVAFFENHLLKNFAPRELVVGYDFTFGSQRKGTFETLEKLGEKHGVPVTVVPPHFSGKCLISSTEIRRLVEQGSVERANALLGRPFSLEGIVVKGRGYGRILGIHTANLRTENELLPKTGVYTTLTTVKGKPYKSVTNIGPNPTFGGTELSIETHLLRYHGNLVHRPIRVEFIRRLRDEKKFSGPETLKKQILKDIQTAEKQLKRS